MTTSILVPERLSLLDAMTLDRGTHFSFDEGHCALEVVAWLAGESHTDAPECVSLVLRRFMFQLNDAWGDAARQKLKPFLPRLVGTADDGHDEEREYLVLDWLIQTNAPTWLDLAGLTDNAAELRALDPIMDETTADAAAGAARDAHLVAQATLDACPDATLPGCLDAGLDACRESGLDASLTTPLPGGLGAVLVIARSVRDAAHDAALSAALSAGAAPAARAALQPTVETLQASALDLLDRMLQVGENR